MTTQDCMIFFAPFAVLWLGMFLAFGITYYNDAKGNWQ
jgi:hypothetical protein